MKPLRIIPAAAALLVLTAAAPAVATVNSVTAVRTVIQGAITNPDSTGAGGSIAFDNDAVAAGTG